MKIYMYQFIMLYYVRNIIVKSEIGFCEANAEFLNSNSSTPVSV